MKPLLFPKDAQFWYETLRSFGHITYGGADFGEVVSTSVRPRVASRANTPQGI